MFLTKILFNLLTVIEYAPERKLFDQVVKEYKDYRKETRLAPPPLALPHQCKVCGKSFGSSNALTYHVTRNHQPSCRISNNQILNNNDVIIIIVILVFGNCLAILLVNSKI